MKEGERQVAPTRDGIRRDHLARYEWAASRLPAAARVVDLACGVGYGTQLLAEAAQEAIGLDKDGDALAYARRHYHHPRARFWSSVAHKVSSLGKLDVAVCFETLEHIEDPRPLLQSLRAAPVLLASVPNELAFPWKHHEFHHRHYTPDEFRDLLAECGWQVVAWFGQQGPESEVEPGLLTGRTVIAVARRAEPVAAPDDPKPQHKADTPPRHVAILGLGPSVSQYLGIAKRYGGRFSDEVWGINAIGDVFTCDRIFHMDDVRVQEIRAAERPGSNIAVMLKWLKQHPGPVITSRAHPDYLGLVEFPLEAVVNEFNHAYFNSTAAYAVAYAIHLGVRKISIFGFDFTYPNAHHAEKGRACVEFWLGIAVSKGIELSVAQTSSLLDACEPGGRLYGYDTLDVRFAADSSGHTRAIFSPKAQLPTADEIEDRYDHNKHPSPLMSGPVSS